MPTPDDVDPIQDAKAGQEAFFSDPSRAGLHEMINDVTMLPTNEVKLVKNPVGPGVEMVRQEYDSRLAHAALELEQKDDEIQQLKMANENWQGIAKSWQSRCEECLDKLQHLSVPGALLPLLRSIHDQTDNRRPRSESGEQVHYIYVKDADVARLKEVIATLGNSG